MDQIEHLALSLLAAASPGDLILALVAGTIGGLFAGLMPGVSGRVGLVLVTPLALTMGPMAGAVFLVAFHSVIHTSGSIPAILIGAPTSSVEAATVIDGYPMTRKGEGPRAIGASLAASAVGGVIGALFLLTLAPVALTLTRYIGAPESAALSLLGLLSIAALSSGGMTGGLAGGVISACLGIIIASIGLDNFSNAGRFTFGLPVLSDGISVAVIVTSLFVIPELVTARSSGPPGAPARLGQAAVMQGFFETFRHRWLLLRSSLLGTGIGFIPGLGAGVAVWIAYGHARQSEPSDVPYGEGAIQGVIAPEAANNSKEGGALAPALFFGIPSSSAMGILLAAFMLIGVEIGPRMMMERPEFVYLMGFTNIASNLIAVPICLMILPLMARIATVRIEVVAPIALAAGISATWLTEPILFTLITMLIFSALGLMLKIVDLPRAPLLLGFVLAPAIEQGMMRASMIQGMSSFTRPGVLAIVALGLAMSLPALIRRYRGGGERRTVAPPRPDGLLRPGLAIIGAVMAGGLIGLPDVPLLARLMPGIAGATGLIAIAAILWQNRSARGETLDRAPPDARLLGLVVIMLAATAWIGIAAAASIFVVAALIVHAGMRPHRALLIGLPLGGIVHLLDSIQA